MPLATIRPAGEQGLYHIHFLDRVDPGFGVGGGGQHPDHSLPGGGLHPSNRPPGSFNPVFPDNSLPSHPPPQVAPGTIIVLVRQQDGKWHYAAIQPGSPPPRPLPEPPPGRPDQGLPGQGGMHPSGQPIIPPGATAPPMPGQPLPPTAEPKY